MRIDARFSDGMLKIDGFVFCNKQGVQGAVTFLIDTGSDITSIGEKDGSHFACRLEAAESIFRKMIWK